MFWEMKSNWREYYAASFESYNRSYCEALSSTTARFSPIEIWRPGYKVTPYNIPIIRESKSDKHDKHFDEQKRTS